MCEKVKKRQQYLYKIATLACFNYKYDKEDKILTFSYLEHQAALAKFEKLLNTDCTIVQLKIEKLKTLQKKIADNELQTVPYSKYRQKKQVNLPTNWEKIEGYLNEKTLFKFINTIWYAISSHANLLRWFSFALILLSFPFPSFPLILVVTGAIVAYLIFRFIYFSKSNKTSTFPNLLEAIEKDKVLDHLKQEVFNNAQYKKQLSILQSQLLHLDIKAEKLYKNIYSQTNKDNILKIKLENSSLYKNLNTVSPKTQLIASLVTKLMNVTLCAYVISWAISICFNVIGALTLASFISSPLAVALFILIPACIFFIRHLIQYQSIKNTYQRNIHTLLKEPCEFNFIDKKGAPQKTIIEKWQKFEYLSKEIQRLETEINQCIENNQSSQESKKLFLLFSDYLKDHDIYKSNYQDKRQRQNIPSSEKRKKFLNRLFSFSAGGLYGFSLGEQIVFESSLGFKKIFEITLLPLYSLFFLPLIIINGLANYFTYHLNSRQQNLLFFTEHLDSKLQILEYRREILSYLTAILKELDTPTIDTEKKLAYLDLAVKKISSKKPHQPLTKFFMSSTRSLTPLLLKEPYLELSEANETGSCPDLTR